MQNNLFHKARYKLTAYYVAIVVIILATFSSVLIYTIESKLHQSFNGKIIISSEDKDDPIKTAGDSIEFIIYTIDGILLLVIGAFSYVLAGKTLKPIRESLDMQKRFSADASHDLRTPLAIITTESEVALQSKLTNENELRKVIQSNLEEAKKMTSLVHDLLLISRGDGENFSNNDTTSVDLHNFIEKIVLKLKPQAQNKYIGLTLSEYLPIQIKINKNNIERAITNIIQNAINYTTVGNVSVAIQEDRERVRIITSDTGVGISEEDLPLVFNRFYKASHSRNDDSGSGLGLPIAKQIIEQHNGAIHIASEVKEGTTVTIFIPK